MTAAPYPANVRAKGWRFELDHERIRQSDTWALAPAEVRPWLLMLWMTAWEQMPCGSLPADDELIAARIGMPSKTFAKHKHCLMRGWWLADDGRQYHNVLVERVTEMLGIKEKERNRKAAFRLRMDAERMASSQGNDALSHGTTTGQTPDTHGSDPGRDDTGTGTGTGTKKEDRGNARKRAIPAIVNRPEDVPEQVWDDWLQLRKKKNAPVTQTVLEGAMGESVKAGMTLEGFLRVWCTRGTQGLIADWIKPNERTPPQHTGPDPALAKIKADRLKAVPIPANIREQMKALAGNGVRV